MLRPILTHVLIITIMENAIEVNDLCFDYELGLHEIA